MRCRIQFISALAKVLRGYYSAMNEADQTNFCRLSITSDAPHEPKPAQAPIISCYETQISSTSIGVLKNGGLIQAVAVEPSSCRRKTG
jgi:hypothetical protein